MRQSLPDEDQEQVPDTDCTHNDDKPVGEDELCLEDKWSDVAYSRVTYKKKLKKYAQRYCHFIEGKI